jgi:PKD repeat protein
MLLVLVCLANTIRAIPFSYASDPPVASFTYSPTLPSVNYVTTFDASSSTPLENITSYQWDFGDLNTTTTTSPTITHIFTIATDYLVSLRIVNNEGYSDEISQSITVNPQIPWLEVNPAQRLVSSEEFTVNVEIKNLAEEWHMFGVQFNIQYDAEHLEFVSAVEGSFWSSFAWMAAPPYTYIVAQSHTGYVTVAIGLVGAGAEPTGYVFPHGEGTLVQMTFRTTSAVGSGTSYPISFGLSDEVMGAYNPETQDVTEFPHYPSIGANYYIRIDAPIADFVFNPLQMVTGEVVTFDGSSSHSTTPFEGGAIVSYNWNFGDGTTGTGITATHVFTEPQAYTVTLTVTDNYGNSRSTTQTVNVSRTHIDVNVDTGSVHFEGEVVDFFVQTSIMGKPVDVDDGVATLYFGGQTLDLSSYVENVGTGLYKISYTIPADAYSGTWTLTVNVNYLSMSGTGLKTFLISSTMSNWNAQLVDVNNNLATLQSDVGIMRTNLTAINAQIVGVHDDVATIQTDIGTVTANLTSINARIVEIKDGVATLSTDLGTVQVSIDDLKDMISTPAPTTDVSGIATILYIVVILSAIAAVVASLIYFLPRRHQDVRSTVQHSVRC